MASSYRKTETPSITYSIKLQFLDFWWRQLLKLNISQILEIFSLIVRQVVYKLSMILKDSSQFLIWRPYDVIFWKNQLHKSFAVPNCYLYQSFNKGFIVFFFVGQFFGWNCPRHCQEFQIPGLGFYYVHTARHCATSCKELITYFKLKNSIITK